MNAFVAVIWNQGTSRTNNCRLLHTWNYILLHKDTTPSSGIDAKWELRFLDNGTASVLYKVLGHGMIDEKS